MKREVQDQGATTGEPSRRATAGFAVELRFFKELNDFLPPDRVQRPFTVRVGEPRSVKDLIESLGVPHTEVDLILVDGESVGFDYLIAGPARVSVYPTFESLDVSGLSKLGRPPLRDIRFVADVHLGKLVNRLRLLGFDCLYDRSWDDSMLAARSAADQRVLLTRDRGLLKRSLVTHGIYLHSDQPAEQTREVLRRLDLYRAARPFARCVHCNGLLAKIAKDAARGLIPPRTYQYVDQYLRCDTCGRLYWKGTHWQRLAQLVRDALEPGLGVALDLEAESKPAP